MVYFKWMNGYFSSVLLCIFMHFGSQKSFSTMSDDEYVANGGGGGGPKKKLTVEKIYQKKSQLEHILLRPDTYIGMLNFNLSSLVLSHLYTNHISAYRFC